MSAVTNLAGSAPAAMKTLVVTSSQLEDLMRALVQRRGHLEMSLAWQRAFPDNVNNVVFLAAQVRRYDDLIRLVVNT